MDSNQFDVCKQCALSCAELRVRNFILTTFLSIVFGMSMNFLAHKNKKTL